MSFKPIKEGQEEIVFAKVRDISGQTQSWTFMMSDLYKWSDMMAKKHGISRTEKGLKEDKDLDWLK